MSKRWWVIAVAALALLSLGCGLIGQLTGRLQEEYEKGSEAVATVQSMATQVTETGEEEGTTSGESTAEDEASESPGGGEADLPDLAEDALSELNSYRARFSWTLEKADGSTETFVMEQGATREPPAQYYSMESDGEGMEYIQVENTLWMRYGEEWMQSSSDEAGDLTEDFGSVLMNGSDLYGEIEDEDYKLIGTETVNGIKTQHYEVTYNQSWLSLLDTENLDKVEKGTADVWIADQSGLPAFLVRFEVELNGTVDGEDVTGTITQEVYDVNSGFTIEPPADAEVGGLPDDIPVYPEAEEFMTFGSMTTFMVTDDVSTVNEFYQSALEDAGWTQDEGSAMNMEGMATSTWTKGEETLTLNVVSNEDEGGTQVVISIE